MIAEGKILNYILGNLSFSTNFWEISEALYFIWFPSSHHLAAPFLPRVSLLLRGKQIPFALSYRTTQPFLLVVS